MTTRHPDPVLTANLYCGGLLDDALRGAVLPFWNAVRGAEERALWVVRYSRRGEHLKVRVHGAEADRELLRDAFREHAEGWLETLRDVPPPEERAARFNVPPIDPEDEGTEAAPDRSLLWTTYRRSHVTMGSAPWTEDDEFAARFTACLAAGCERVLAAVEGPAGLQPSARQGLLLRAIVPAMGALGLEREKAVEYLRYHRDWLLRFFMEDAEKEAQAVVTFDEQAAASGAAVERIRGLAEAGWGQGATPWETALASLAEYTRSFQGRPEHRTDPFTRDVSFPPVFKALHGLANQVGVRPLQEAYVHHLVLTAAAGAGSAVAAAGSAAG